MKNFYLVISTLFLLGSLTLFNSCSSDDSEDNPSISFDQLPAESKLFITDHFTGYDVVKTLENSNGYTVFVAKGKEKAASVPGYEIEFDKQGNWLEIEGQDDTLLPVNVLALVPRPIISYINQNYPERGITEIKKAIYGYKIKLAGNPDVELMFDLNGAYLEKEGEEVVISYDKLPTEVQSFLGTHFKDQTPSKIKKETDGYEVKYQNDVEVEFSLNGIWTSVDADDNRMPQTIIALLPEKLVNYVKTTYPSKYIEQIKNKVSTYEIELSGDVDLVFDRAGELWSSNNNGGGSQGENKRVEFSALPKSIQDLLTEHFLKSTKFLYAELDDEYEVKLANGTSLEFLSSGELKSVEVLPGNQVPNAIVLNKILDFVKKNYSTKVIEEYEKKKLGYKVELSGYPEIELLFDINGDFKGID